jgi:hypothetical protein
MGPEHITAQKQRYQKMIYHVVDVMTGDVVAAGSTFEEIEGILEADDNVERVLKTYYDHGPEYIVDDYDDPYN